MYIIPETMFGSPIQTIPRLNQAHQIENWNEEKSHKNSLLREAPNQRAAYSIVLIALVSTSVDKNVIDQKDLT